MINLENQNEPTIGDYNRLLRSHDDLLEQLANLKRINPSTKNWYKSKGVMGGLVAVLVGVLSIAGNAFGWSDAIMQPLVSMGGVGGLVAIVGRVTASHEVNA